MLFRCEIFFKELNMFIQQWCINCIKCDRKDIYHFTIEFYSKRIIFILNFLFNFEKNKFLQKT